MGSRCRFLNPMWCKAQRSLDSCRFGLEQRLIFTLGVQ